MKTAPAVIEICNNAGATTTVYHYDQWGQVIAESGASGTMPREYAYTRPEHGRARLAIIDSAMAAIYPVVPDHLGTPHASSTISQYFLFPGQYSDTESGLHYNWH